MSSQDSTSSAVQDDTHFNQSVPLHHYPSLYVQFQGFRCPFGSTYTTTRTLIHDAHWRVHSDDSYGSPGSYGLRHQALEELSAFTRVLRPFFGGDRGRSFSDEYYSDDMLDPDSMTYEELRALSDSVGSVNKGLSSSIITTLPTRKYSKPKNCDFGDEQCTVCRCEFEEKVLVKVLPCGHCFHPSCIDQWLEISKKCPICSAEVESSP